VLEAGEIEKPEVLLLLLHLILLAADRDQPQLHSLLHLEAEIGSKLEMMLRLLALVLLKLDLVSGQVNATSSLKKYILFYLYILLITYFAGYNDTFTGRKQSLRVVAVAVVAKSNVLSATRNGKATKTGSFCNGSWFSFRGSPLVQ
jgi:hypothetical protein